MSFKKPSNDVWPSFIFLYRKPHSNLLHRVGKTSTWRFINWTLSHEGRFFSYKPACTPVWYILVDSMLTHGTLGDATVISN